MTTQRAALNKILQLEDSYSRLPLLLEYAGFIESDDWLHLLGYWWECCDNIGIHRYELEFALDCYGTWTSIHQMMTMAERRAFDRLPDVLTVYRGCYEINKWGASWSLNREVAEKFPYLTRYSNEGRPLLIKATIPKSRIAALKLGRGEEEIITFHRPKCISISTARRA